MYKQENLKAILLCGEPCSGKTTWITNNLDKTWIKISRDDCVMQVANGLPYDKAWQTVDQKEVDKKLNSTFQNAFVNQFNIVIDMTNLTKKSRARWIQKLKGYEVSAVVIRVDENTLAARNQYRMIAEGKTIPPDVIKRMKDSFEMPTFEEGFKEIHVV